uniref:Uncharacterized protein n=1 Tax=Pseudo-nitzschia arenysensis TaxID=697910 RepID=A0A7R9ZTJ8_9STRA|mmetsp:Transcript_114/g.278  ORF Transcript_114/g.278 Transcript_114/m.278 type:complete len:352 (+) Transcript_114:211-1266(+)
MFRFDLSVLSTRSCRTADKVPYKAIQDSASTPERKQRTKKSTSSPARTAKTQSSSTCSANNNASLNSIELDFFPTTTSRDTYSSAVAAWTTESTSPPKQDGFRSKSPSPPSSLPLIRKAPSYDSYGKKSSSTISAMGKSASLAGKTVLKNLRKNISLMNTMSPDSGTPTRLTSRIRRNRCKSMPTIPREVSVDFVEGGEGVEITPSSSKSDCSYNDGILRGKNFLVPKIVRETSTYATTSLTSGEESAEIYQEDDDIRKLCDLMKKIRNHSNHDANNVRFDSDESSALYTFEDTLSAPGQELGTDEIDVNQEACLEPCQAPDSFDDLMVFVNNEHKVLEYAPDEFQEFDSI